AIPFRLTTQPCASTAQPCASTASGVLQPPAVFFNRQRCSSTASGVLQPPAVFFNRQRCSSTASHRADDEERFRSRRHLAGQRRVRKLVRPILFAREE